MSREQAVIEAMERIGEPARVRSIAREADMGESAVRTILKWLQEQRRAWRYKGAYGRHYWQLERRAA